MSAIASQITSLTIVYSIVYSDADQRKHQSSASLAFVRGIHRWSVNSPHKRPVTRKMFPFDDVIMENVILTKLSSLAVLKVVKMTTFSTISVQNFVKMTTFPFQWCKQHYSDVTSASWRIKSPATWLFIQQHVRETAQQTSKPCITGPLWGEFLPMTDRFPSQRVTNADNIMTP